LYDKLSKHIDGDESTLMAASSGMMTLFATTIYTISIALKLHEGPGLIRTALDQPISGSELSHQYNAPTAE
jgi:hypothetical protein